MMAVDKFFMATNLLTICCETNKENEILSKSCIKKNFSHYTRLEEKYSIVKGKIVKWLEWIMCGVKVMLLVVMTVHQIGKQVILAPEVLEDKLSVKRPYTMHNYLSFAESCPEFINETMNKHCTGRYSRLTKWQYDDLMAQVNAEYNVYKTESHPGHFLVIHNMRKIGQDCLTVLIHHYTLLQCDNLIILLKEANLQCLSFHTDLVEDLLKGCHNHAHYASIHKTAMFYPDSSVYNLARRQYFTECGIAIFGTLFAILLWLLSSLFPFGWQNPLNIEGQSTALTSIDFSIWLHLFG